VSNLASSGLFTDFPKFHSDIEIENLDLDQLTRRFEFGGITGRLSGYVRQLYMENWHPVTFFAWLGTPETDDSRHRISQKAVKNIANVAGGGASDFMSRSFLNLFDTFGYDKIGLGCYLHNGVCQLMGVEATESGYAIITGGGLPRIDVIGYNSRIDWNVLMDRLKRISTSDEVIID
ncbi:MAG: C4-dicarboxylate ABC transporter, partial [Methylobacter sp.]